MFLTDLRIEWAKSLARAERWEEEFVLVQEEMRRVLVFLEKKAEWWVESSKIRQNGGGEFLSGLYAYAMKQSDILLNLACNFALEWLTVRTDCGLPAPTDWPSRFLHFDPLNRRIIRRPNRTKLRRRGAIVFSEIPDPSTVHGVGVTDTTSMVTGT